MGASLSNDKGIETLCLTGAELVALSAGDAAPHHDHGLPPRQPHQPAGVRPAGLLQTGQPLLQAPAPPVPGTGDIVDISTLSCHAGYLSTVSTAAPYLPLPSWPPVITTLPSPVTTPQCWYRAKLSCPAGRHVSLPGDDI